jgi:hypothetical protein
MAKDKTFGQQLKRLLFPGRHLLKQIEARSARIEAAGEASLVLKRKTDIAGSPRFQAHLAALAGPATGAADISPGFRFAADDLRPDITDDDPGRTVVCTVALGDSYRREMGACLASQRDYARRSGHAFADLAAPPSRLLRAPAWYKIALVFHLLNRGYQRIAFFDADILVTRPEFSLHKLFARLEESGRDLLITNDESGINTGIFLARGGTNLARLLDIIWSYLIDPRHPTWEQIGVRTLADEFPVFAGRLLIEPNGREFNSFPAERAQVHRLGFQASTWQPGDFVCHFSGLRGPELAGLIPRYQPPSRPQTT